MALSKEHKALQQVLQQPGNNRCVDCNLQGKLPRQDNKIRSKPSPRRLLQPQLGPV